MKTLNIRKGKWVIDDFRLPGSKIIQVGPFNIKDTGKGKKYSIDQCSEEFKANAELIAEAGTIANECGLTPRQLLEQRDKLLKVLQAIYNDIELNNVKGGSDELNIMVQSAIQDAKGE